jgi:signal transduction histidine kinase
LNFARQSQPNKKINDLNHMVTECVLLTQKQAAFKDVTITSELAPTIPEMLFDKGQLDQSIINLILNAVEATPAGGRITVTTKYCDEKVNACIAIKDTGGGISKEDLEKIFDPFFTTKETGTGLGLAITHGIIEQHRGRIDVQSAIGKGACFTIYLPILKENDHGPASSQDTGGG